MTGYRLTFSTQNIRAKDFADSVIAADETLGELLSGLGEEVVVLGHDSLISGMIAQFYIRFETGDDATALRASNEALRGVSLPIDGERLDRRSRRYQPVNA